MLAYWNGGLGIYYFHRASTLNDKEQNIESATLAADRNIIGLMCS
jgi:hypothetical protein